MYIYIGRYSSGNSTSSLRKALTKKFAQIQNMYDWLTQSDVFLFIFTPTEGANRRPTRAIDLS